LSNQRAEAIVFNRIFYRLSNCRRKSKFIRRFLMHIVPKGFVRIRHCGFLANRNRSTKLARCRAIFRKNHRQIERKNAPLAPGLPRQRVRGKIRTD
jgi:hypothetical protein